MTSYPILFNLEEIERLTAQSSNLSDDILPLMGKQAKTCLEIGCGAGSNLPALCKYNTSLNYTGIDVSETAIQYAKSVYSSDKADFQIGDGSKLPFMNNQFELVVLRLVLWGASNRINILQEAHRVLKPNGMIYCFEPDDNFLGNYPPKKNFDHLVSEWQARVISDGCDPFIGRKLHDLLTKAGFETLSNKVKLSTYDSTNPKVYLKAIGNLWQIFSSKGPSFFDLEKESESWSAAQREAETCVSGAVLTEGYFSVIGKK
ncbi:MAG: class I SAM-dependent methyltransferase [Bdellovibrio sp.]